MSRLTIRTCELTERETRLLQLLADGESYESAAPQVGYKSKDSLKNVMLTILNKMGADNKTHAVALAFRRHLIQ